MVRIRIVLLGCPGVGKGTQANLLAKEFDIPKISTGDILRSAMDKKTPLGEKAQHFIHQGKLVPDDVVIGIIQDRLKENDCQKGFILDGFPRTLIQAEALCKITDIDFVVNFTVDKDELIRRLEGRRTCSQCSKMYHVQFNRPKHENICDECGGKLIQRKDDERKTIEQRFEQYEMLTKPLLKYYSEQDLLIEVDGLGEVEQVFKRVLSQIHLQVHPKTRK